MAKIEFFIPYLFAMFIVALSNNLTLTPEQILAPPRPLCPTQLALVNYACAMIPLVPLPPPPPPPELGNQNGRRHGRRHGHRRRHGNHGTRQQLYCCQWLKHVETECVCDILVRLPPFLSRPNHQYTVIVDDTCSVSYTCGGRLRP